MYVNCVPNSSAVRLRSTDRSAVVSTTPDVPDLSPVLSSIPSYPSRPTFLGGGDSEYRIEQQRNEDPGDRRRRHADASRTFELWYKDAHIPPGMVPSTTRETITHDQPTPNSTLNTTRHHVSFWRTPQGQVAARLPPRSCSYRRCPRQPAMSRSYELW
jgi:hypothetical protein